MHMFIESMFTVFYQFGQYILTSIFFAKNRLVKDLIKYVSNIRIAAGENQFQIISVWMAICLEDDNFRREDNP